MSQSPVPAQNLSDTGDLDVSVIIPSHDYRIDARFVKSWTKKQTCRADRFEVIVVTDDSHPEYEAQTRALLRPHDRLIRCDVPQQNRMHRYHLGASVARGRLLFLTEDHCIANVDCVAEVIAYLARTGEDGAFVTTGHCNFTEIGRMEQRAYEACLPTWLSPGHWNRVRLRGFALKRAVYLQVGGFEVPYRHFSEVLLSVALHQAGCKIGFAEKAQVTHVNHSWLPGLRADVRDHVIGEALYRATHPHSPVEHYLDASPVWANRLALRRDVARQEAWAVARTLWSDVVRGTKAGRWGAARALAAALATRLTRAVCGTQVQALLARVKLLGVELKWRFGSGSAEQRGRLFDILWACVTRWAYLEALAKNDYPLHELPRTATLDLDMDRLRDEQLIGFHARESCNGQTFRWSSEVSTIRLNLAPAHYTATLESAPLRGKNLNFPMGLFWNGAKVPSAALSRKQSRLTFELTPEMFVAGSEQRLTIVCAPAPRARGGREIRALGLPVTALRLQTDGQVNVPREAAA